MVYYNNPNRTGWVFHPLCTLLGSNVTFPSGSQKVQFPRCHFRVQRRQRREALTENGSWTASRSRKLATPIEPLKGGPLYQLYMELLSYNPYKSSYNWVTGVMLFHPSEMELVISPKLYLVRGPPGGCLGGFVGGVGCTSIPTYKTMGNP